MGEIGNSLAATGLNMISQGVQGNVQHKRNKELMGIQYGRQRNLNKQGQELQMDMWNKTNYGAQMDHIKKAGLNPSLMYGMSGGGGTTTGSQSGGAAASGNATRGNMGIEGMMVGAQIELMKAQANKANADAEATSTYRKDNVDRDTDLKGANIEGVMSQIEVNNQKVIESIADTKTTDEIRKSKIEGQVVENIRTISNTLAIETGIRLTERQITEIGQKLEIARKEVDVKGDNARSNRANAMNNRLMRLLNEDLGYAKIAQDNKEMWVKAVSQGLGDLLNLVPTKKIIQQIMPKR